MVKTSRKRTAAILHLRKGQQGQKMSGMRQATARVSISRHTPSDEDRDGIQWIVLITVLASHFIRHTCLFSRFALRKKSRSSTQVCALGTQSNARIVEDANYKKESQGTERGHEAGRRCIVRKIGRASDRGRRYAVFWPARKKAQEIER